MSYICPIDYCSCRFSSREKRNDHLYNVDHSQIFYECPYIECPKRYRLTHGISRHLINAHCKTWSDFDIKPITVIIRPAGKNMTLPDKQSLLQPNK